MHGETFTPERQGSKVIAAGTLKMEEGRSTVEELYVGGFIFHLFPDRAAQ